MVDFHGSSTATVELSRAQLRATLGRFATGVTVVTFHEEDGSPRGFTASAFTSLSLDPPMILVCVDKRSDSHDPLAEEGRPFGVNILASAHGAIAKQFAGKGGAGKFARIPYDAGEHGAPLLHGAHAALECRVARVVEGGDHTVLFGDVLGLHAGADTAPLLYHAGVLHDAPLGQHAPRHVDGAWAKYVGDRTVPEFLRAMGFDPADRSRPAAIAAVDRYLALQRDSARDLPAHLRRRVDARGATDALVAHIVDSGRWHEADVYLGVAAAPHATAPPPRSPPTDDEPT